MNSIEFSTTVESTGEVRVAGVPFAAGTEVDVIVSPKRKSAEEFRRAWEGICQRLRGVPHLQAVSDDEIRAEIGAHRAGQ